MMISRLCGEGRLKVVETFECRRSNMLDMMPKSRRQSQDPARALAESYNTPSHIPGPHLVMPACASLAQHALFLPRSFCTGFLLSADTLSLGLCSALAAKLADGVLPPRGVWLSMHDSATVRSGRTTAPPRPLGRQSGLLSRARTSWCSDKSAEERPRLRVLAASSEARSAFERLDWGRAFSLLQAESGRGLGAGTSTTSSRWKLEKSGDESGSAVRSMISFSFNGATQGSLALRQVARRASLFWLGAGAHAADETEDIDDARDERDELSETIDSGEDESDVDERANDGRRPQS